MQLLPKDRRGYPVPFIILRDKNDVPHFQINDGKLVQKCIQQKLCAICGQKLGTDMWVTGGPLSAFHPNGRYFDTPVHGECGRYAMQVCPYLAAPMYSKRLDHSTLNSEDFNGQVFMDPTVIEERPVFFVMARIKSFKVEWHSKHHSIAPARPYQEVLFWKDGREINASEATFLCVKHRINIDIAQR